MSDDFPTEWQFARLEDSLDALIDYRGKTPTKTTFGIPLVTAKIIKGGHIEEPQEFIAEHEFDKWMSRGLPLPGDVVMTTEAPLGEIAQLDGRKVALAQRVITLRGRAGYLDNTFLRFLMQSAFVQDQLSGRASGTTVMGIRQSELRGVTLVIPTINEQRAIARVLRSLDDKIELNRRMNQTLEDLAGALFGAWFMEHGSSAEPVMAETLIDQRILLIGDGYRAKNSEMGSHGTPFVRAGNLQDSGINLTDADLLRPESVAAAGQKIGMVGDVAFTSKGTVGRLTRVSTKTGAFVYSPQVCFWRSLAPNRLHPNVLYRWMKTDEFLGQVAAVSGQTDMAPYVSLRDQRRMEINLPKSASQQKLGTRLAVFDDMIAANNEQSHTLAALRDTLLPKLLSGELRVKLADKSAGAAT